MSDRFALIGCGEAGSTFAIHGGWQKKVRAYDIDPVRLTIMTQAGMTTASDLATAVSGARMIVSLVTADNALEIVRESAPLINPGSIWCDMNSISPQTKIKSAHIIEQCGGRFVDAAVLAPVIPAHMQVPLLLSGSAAEDARRELSALNFADIRVIDDQVGRASAIKMVRSVMIKGIEALTGEMMAAAEAAGVTHEVLSSLDASISQGNWSDRAAYNLARMAQHGERRAAEMEEVASTLISLGIQPVMTAGTVTLQRAAARAVSSKKAAA
ncbi:MAG: DUF1932 domain-containing protein [Pseudomonadota bacterium]